MMKKLGNKVVLLIFSIIYLCICRFAFYSVLLTSTSTLNSSICKICCMKAKLLYKFYFETYSGYEIKEKRMVEEETKKSRRVKKELKKKI